MGYSIIRNTKFIDLEDGSILWLSRQGCNNDDCCREKNEYIARIMSKEKALNEINDYLKRPTDEIGNLKIGSRWSNFHQLGRYLERKYKQKKNISVLNLELITQVFDHKETINENETISFYKTIRDTKETMELIKEHDYWMVYLIRE